MLFLSHSYVLILYGNPSFRQENIWPLQEIEFRMEPWIWCMALFTAWRILIIIYSSIVNDMVFAYHVVMCLLWLLFIAGNIFAWLVVHSFYHELCEVTRLEDVARVKVSCTLAVMKFPSLAFSFCAHFFFFHFVSFFKHWCNVRVKVNKNTKKNKKPTKSILLYLIRLWCIYNH